jgi:transcription-repair coupling factor (superfamily II helicase)
VHAVREDPAKKGLLYAGTETGTFVSFDDGGHWQTLQLNLPNTPIHDLIVHNDDLVVATHGRSFWVLDSIAPLRQVTASVASEPAHLFTPSVATRARIGHREPRRYPVGENPLEGGYIYYWLKEAPKEPAKLEFLDAQGKTIRKFTSEVKKTEENKEEFDVDPEVEHIPAEAGLNRFVWDLRYEPPVKIPAAIYDNGQPAGPLALPGAFQVRLTVSGKSYTAPMEIKMDPRVKTSAEDLRGQFDLLLKLRDREDEMNKAILGIRDLRAQLQSLEKRLGPAEQTKPVVGTAAELRKKITAIEEDLIQVNATAQEDEANYPTKLNSKLGYLTGVTDSADAAPTEAEVAVFAELDKQLETQLAAWREVLSKDLVALNESMRKSNVPSVAPAASRTY